MVPSKLAVGYGEAELRKTAQQAGERQDCLHAGQRGTETEMDAVTESEVVDLGSAELESLSVLVSTGVSVGGRQTDEDLASGGNGHTANLDRLNGVTERRVRNRSVVAQQLFERWRHVGGSDRSWSSCSGCRSSATTQLPIRVALVSCPATISGRQWRAALVR